MKPKHAKASTRSTSSISLHRLFSLRKQGGLLRLLRQAPEGLQRCAQLRVCRSGRVGRVEEIFGGALLGLAAGGSSGRV